MDLLKHMNEAMNYIEENLTEEIDFRVVARLAQCSEYHFKRMFPFLAGITLSEYIRRRRLSLAAFELHHSSLRVIDVAVKYGYNSPDSFSRAFHSLHGVTPSEARKCGRQLKAFPRMTFQLSIKGVDEMDYRIEQKDAFNVVGVMKRVAIIFEGENPEITEMWKTLTKEKMSQLKKLSNIEPDGMIQASTNFSEGRMEGKGQLDHYIGVATTKECPENYSKLEVPALTWAVFESTGPFPGTLQETWGRIYSEWFPSSSYQITEGPELLSIKSEDLTTSSVKSEIWIPVTRK
ncbi:AraC family transcriptional regulator [Thalassobacillus pellis]|uniref:AraC family transcriptional regulator n=1 Tax=Thalassobacillus pellis TaxID=748008 RepID=UPI00195F4A67|nr:AraC family transcriptional regulator [Thalassobacillus pellis]MBM7553316.1 AraC family transcriptional regulator [Thalassobacillus pellis]